MKKVFPLFILLTIKIAAFAQTKSIIYFDSNKSELKKSSVHMLDSISDFLLSSKDYQININGYCDNSGNENKNKGLSEKRSNVILNYLKNKNIPSQFITAKGFSSSNPLAGNDNEIGKAKNRRAEIIIHMNTPILVEHLMDNEVKQQPDVVPTIIDSASVPIIEKKESFSSTTSINDLEVGKTLILKNLNFEGGTAILLPEAKPTLELLVKILKKNPTVEIEIGGHVCCANDMQLSIYRAQSVYKYLIKKGIDESRLTYKGYSRSKPIYEDDRRAFEARANRRVEITVLKK